MSKRDCSFSRNYACIHFIKDQASRLLANITQDSPILRASPLRKAGAEPEPFSSPLTPTRRAQQPGRTPLPHRVPPCAQPLARRAAGTCRAFAPACRWFDESGFLVPPRCLPAFWCPCCHPGTWHVDFFHGGKGGCLPRERDSPLPLLAPC